MVKEIELAEILTSLPFPLPLGSILLKIPLRNAWFPPSIVIASLTLISILPVSPIPKLLEISLPPLVKDKESAWILISPALPVAPKPIIVKISLEVVRVEPSKFVIIPVPSIVTASSTLIFTLPAFPCPAGKLPKASLICVWIWPPFTRERELAEILMSLPFPLPPTSMVLPNPVITPWFPWSITISPSTTILILPVSPIPPKLLEVIMPPLLKDSEPALRLIFPALPIASNPKLLLTWLEVVKVEPLTSIKVSVPSIITASWTLIFTFPAFPRPKILVRISPPSCTVSEPAWIVILPVLPIALIPTRFWITLDWRISILCVALSVTLPAWLSLEPCSDPIPALKPLLCESSILGASIRIFPPPPPATSIKAPFVTKTSPFVFILTLPLNNPLAKIEELRVILLFPKRVTFPPLPW